MSLLATDPVARSSVSPPAPVPVLRSARRHDIDALRLLAVLLLLLYHSSRPFDSEPWHVKNDVLSPTLELLGGLVTPWRLPLLFVLAGMGTCFALRHRSGAAYFRERCLRLLVPLMVGIAVVVPPQVYVERIGSWMPNRLSPRNFDGTFLEFYPRFFLEGAYPSGNFSWHHLWFVAYLWVFSLVALPLFLWLRTAPGRASVARLADVVVSGPRILALGLPLVLVDVGLRGRFPTFQVLIGDWANVSHSLLLFVFGYVVAADDRVGLAIARNRRRCLGLALILAGVRLFIALLGVERPAPYSGGYVVLTTLRTCVEWFWVLAVLGYGRVYLNVPRPWLGAAGELVYPFYIIHQTVIVLVAFYVLSWPGGVVGQYFAIASVSLVVTALLCLLVKQTAVSRLAFGLRVRPARRNEGGQESGDAAVRPGPAGRV